ncbi:lipoate--protein ligase [Clostridium subterminale]|uniref:lipoate--protein ligase n=1 Tax=Clostridium subterminale TaxID=1550 RepID=A0ABP3VYS0_CLOSU
MNKVIISKEVNPYYNLALEEDLFRNIKSGETILYLWQNENTVVIGRNQNPYKECDLGYMKEKNIILARRISGGGAVFHDLGNLNFTFITKEIDSNLDKQLQIIKDAVEEYGFKVEFSGRNDLLLNNRKFSGHAFYCEDGNYFHHGTLMIDVDITKLEKVLTPSKLKLKSKGIESVKSRVINLIDICSELTVENLIQSLVSSFKNIYGNFQKIDIYNMSNYVPKLYDEYSSKLWNYGESPQYDVVLEEKTGIGNVDINLTVESGKIVRVKIFSDTLENIDLRKIEEQLIGIIFSREEVIKLIEKYIS